MIDWLVVSALFAICLYVSLVIVAWRQWKYCKRYAEPIAWIMVGIFGAAFYIVFLVDYQDGILNRVIYNFWSIALRVETVISLLAIEGARLYRMKKKYGC
jgi:hypothetical protein